MANAAGAGGFAAPETLNRVLKKPLQNFILNQFADIFWQGINRRQTPFRLWLELAVFLWA